MGKSTRREYERRICKAMDYIAKHLTDNPTLDQIATEAAFSKYHFHRIFSALVGETVNDFTRRLKLERAANMLHFNTQRDITSIAIDCGFSSSQNFAKAFRKHFGQSPSQFRTQETQKSNLGNTNATDGNVLSHVFDHDVDVSQHLSTTERTSAMSIEVKTLEPFDVAYMRAIGPYGLDYATVTFNKLIEWAKPKGLMDNPQYLGITWDNPCVTPAEKCRYDACLAVNDDINITEGADRQTVAGGLYAINHKEIVNHDFETPWRELFQNWLPDSGYVPDDRPSFEKYLVIGKDDPKGRWVVEVHLPIKPL